MEKGGCKIGRVGESPKGGCKVGKKKIVIRRKKKVDENTAKKTASSTMIKPAPKKIKITIKKKVVAPAPKKKIKIKVKKNKTPELTAITGLTTRQAKAMSPAELFGKLPKELGQMVLQPSKRGGGPTVAGYTKNEFINDLERLYKKEFPRGRIGSSNATKQINRYARSLIGMVGFNFKTGRSYKTIKLPDSLDRKKLNSLIKEKIGVERTKPDNSSSRAEAEKKTRAKFKIGQSIFPNKKSYSGDDFTRPLLNTVVGDKGKIVKFTTTGMSNKMENGRMRNIKYNKAQNL